MLPTECSFGGLRKIFLPPYCVTVPRLDFNIETLLSFTKPTGPGETMSSFPQSELSSFLCKYTFYVFKMALIVLRLYHLVKRIRIILDIYTAYHLSALCLAQVHKKGIGFARCLAGRKCWHIYLAI